VRAGVIRNAQARPGRPAPAVFYFYFFTYSSIFFFILFILRFSVIYNILFFFLESAAAAHTRAAQQHNHHRLRDGVVLYQYDFSHISPVGRGNENEIYNKRLHI